MRVPAAGVKMSLSLGGGGFGEEGAGKGEERHGRGAAGRAVGGPLILFGAAETRRGGIDQATSYNQRVMG